MVILILDPYPTLRLGLKILLEEYLGYFQLNENSSVFEHFRNNPKPKADVIFVGVFGEVFTENNNHEIDLLRMSYPASKIILLMEKVNDSIILAGTRAGANGYVSRQSDPLEIIKHLGVC
ncbi:response regulator transcription factor [Dyadobacter psychrotolerans]|uniref:Response regulator transcription factor n=1 Tax=Dyadobacter psychrotolerans TaxID=2541721 RepID=A0A4R5DC21_9BACT|nr:response regulator transcription factor [Dyadobacter psychrotolerans]TDE09550.1 response regulator transcription factor [Dyadobacter psychrotolerans]